MRARVSSEPIAVAPGAEAFRGCSFCQGLVVRGPLVPTRRCVLEALLLKVTAGGEL